MTKKRGKESVSTPDASSTTIRDWTRLPKNHPYKRKSFRDQQRLLDTIYTLRINGDRMLKADKDNAAARAFQIAEEMYDGTYHGFHRS